MKRRKASAKAVAAMVMAMSDEELVAMIDHGSEVRDFLAGLVKKSAESVFITHMSDGELAAEFPQFAGLVPKYRQLATELGYSGPVAWRVRAGFTLKLHAPKAGPCYEKFSYLQDWRLKNDGPTRESVVFWIPRLVPESTGKNVEKQMALLAEMRERHGLPARHLTSFGSAALLSGLILAEFRRSGDRVPLNRLWTRSDTFRAGGGRLSLGSFGEHGLLCGSWLWDDDRNDRLGCFALGVETLGD